MRLTPVGILCILCFAAVFSAPPQGHRRQAQEIYRLKSFAAKLQYYLNRAKGEIKHLREENEELKKRTTPTTPTTETPTETTPEPPPTIVECTDDEYKADENDPRKFYHCSNKLWQKKECHECCRFNPKFNICVWKNWEDLGLE